MTRYALHLVAPNHRKYVAEIQVVDNATPQDALDAFLLHGGPCPAWARAWRVREMSVPYDPYNGFELTPPRDVTLNRYPTGTARYQMIPVSRGGL